MKEHSGNPKLVARAAESAAQIVAKTKGKGDTKPLQADLRKAARKAQRSPEGEIFLPRDRASALVQAAMDLHAKRRGAPTAMEAVLDDTRFSNADPGWATVLGGLIGKWLTPDAKFIEHSSLTDFQIPIPNKTSIALYSDWGTGRPAAEAVADQITRKNVEFTIHLGDIYYAGLQEEVKDRFLDKLPTPAKLKGHFALNANHEMYSGGHGYFKKVLPALGQPASYFCLVNKHWRVIGLDSAYKDKKLHKPQIEWLQAQLANDDGRRNILLSHHQLFSCFEDVDKSILKTVTTLLDAGKIHAWFWGHEHFHIVYKPFKGMLARCIGHGAIPYTPPGTTFKHPEFKVQFVNRRLRQDSVQGVNGFATLTLNGNRADVEYIDEDGQMPFSETL